MTSNRTGRDCSLTRTLVMAAATGLADPSHPAAAWYRTCDR
jgi:hypothetical protein